MGSHLVNGKGSSALPGMLSRRDLLRTTALAALGPALLSGCGGGTASSGKAGIKVGFAVWDTAIPFAVPLSAAVKKAAAAAGMELKLVSAGGDPSVQSQQLAQLATQQVDVICVTPLDVTAIIPAAKAAEAQGVPVIGCLGTIKGQPYIGSDDVEFGRQMGKLILDALSSRDIEGEKRVGLLRGLAGGSPDRDRYKGIKEVLAKDPSVKIVAQSATDWALDKALTATQNMLQRFGKGKIHLIHGFGGGVETPGAKYAHTDAGRADVVFTGGELPKSTKTAIEKGWTHGVVIQDPTTAGQVIIEALPKMQPAFAEVPTSAKIPLPLCTKDNLADFKAF